MVASRLGIVLLSAECVRAANEFVAETFMSWDFGHDNSHSVELLIATFIVIIVIAFLMVSCLVIIITENSRTKIFLMRVLRMIIGSRLPNLTHT